MSKFDIEVEQQRLERCEKHGFAYLLTPLQVRQVFALVSRQQSELTEASAKIAQLDARLKAATAPQWQPIETAPKDGTYVLLGSAACGGAWVGKYEEVYQSGYRPEKPWQSMMLNTWHLPVKYPYLMPTHWMPLPAAPSPADNGGGNG